MTRWKSIVDTINEIPPNPKAKLEPTLSNPNDVKNAEFNENSIPSNCVEGETDFGEIGYGGPAPPDKEHMYIFKLYALDKKLDVSEGSTKQKIESSIKNHIIAETILRGKFAP